MASPSSNKQILFSSTQIWRKAILLIFLAAISTLILFPVWLVQYPPIVDYPSHLARWFVLAHIHDPHYHFDQVYAADWRPYPYTAVDAFAVGLQRLMNVYLVGRLILTICILGLPLAAWFFLRRASPGNEYLALWTIVITYNPSLLSGSIQNQISLALCFLALGTWINYLARPAIAKWCLLSVMFTIVYLTHLMSFAMAAIILTSFAILAHKPLRLIFLSWLMFVPGFVLYFYARAPLASAPASSVGFGTFHSKILGLAYPLRGFSKFLDFFSLTILLLCVVAVVLRDKGFRLHFPWFVTTVLLVALYFATPGQIGDGGYIDLRILLYAFIVALASFRIQGLKRFVVLAGLALIVARSVELTYHFVAEQASLEKVIASLVVIPAQSRVLPLEPRWEGDRSIIFRPYMHAYAYGIVDKGWIAPSLMGVGIGVRPIRLSQDIYCPNKICGPLIETEPDWTRVQRDYDFIWAYNLPYYTPKLERLGSCVYNEGPVRVFRMNR